jgi:hypothetical protein
VAHISEGATIGHLVLHVSLHEALSSIHRAETVCTFRCVGRCHPSPALSGDRRLRPAVFTPGPHRHLHTATYCTGLQVPCLWRRKLLLQLTVSLSEL